MPVAKSLKPTQEILDNIYKAINLTAPPMESLESVTIAINYGCIRVDERRFVLEKDDAV